MARSQKPKPSFWSRWVWVTKRDLVETEENLSMKVSEVAEQLAQLNSQLTKAKDEILGKIGDLEESLADVDLPSDAETALEELKGKAQTLDDIVPDAPPPPPPTA